MIAKRVAQALRRQDWAMVSIEFVLVVAGVLLGFQINEWAHNSAAAGIRERSTQRLLEEAEREVAYIRQAVEFERSIVADLSFAIARLAEGRWRPEDEPRMTSGLGRARSMVALAPPSSVYDDIISSGELSTIGDLELRAAIGRYRSTLSFEERMRQQLQTTLSAFEQNPAFRYHVDPAGKQRIDLSVDFAAAMRDERGMQVMALTAENHRILLLLRNRALRDSARMCVELGRFVDRPCDLSLPPPTFD